MASGLIQGKETALGVVNSGQHGLDFQNGEIRLSVLRSAAYCHEKGFSLTDPPARKYMDQGIHEFRLLVTVGDPENVRAMLPGLSDWLASPPAVYAHLPIGNTPEKRRPAEALPQSDEWFSLHPSTLRLMAFKQSEDHKSLLVRLQETTGRSTAATLSIATRTRPIRLQFRPLEIKTLRIRKRGAWREVDPLEDV